MENCTYNEFLAYLLLMASYSDMEFDLKEEHIIQALISEEEYASVLTRFKNDSDYQRIENITSCKERFYATEEKKKEVLDKVSYLFQADGDVSSMELNLLRFLKKLM